MISYQDFAKLEIKIGTVLSAEKIKGSEKLLKIMFDLGNPEPVQVIAGIAQFYNPENLIGKQMPIITNIEPRILKNYQSNGMILAVVANGKPFLLYPDSQVQPGSQVK